MAQGRRFLSTPSARRATVNSFNVYIDGVFLSTPSARRATTAAVGYDDDYEFLSTPSARRATSCLAAKPISIHALREEGDVRRSHHSCRSRISIHALREEGDTNAQEDESSTLVFLSTPSARRATHHSLTGGTTMADFYPRPPRGGRLCNAWSHGVAIGISIHALREEGDHTTAICLRRVSKFLSTPSARRATMVHQAPCGGFRISIHALREEGDTIRTETRR